MSEEKRVIQLAECVDDVRFDTVKSTLERAVTYCNGEGPWKDAGFEPTACALVFVDQHNGSYVVRIMQSNGKLTERIALLEVAKLLTFKDMGYGG